MDIDSTDIDRLLAPELVTLAPLPREKRACIERLLDVAVDAGRVDDRERALADLLEREAVSATGFGYGVAIPHATTSAVSQPSVVVARSAVGVDFDAVDDEPAHIVVLLLTPESTSDDHLTVMSAITRALAHEDVRTALLDADSPAAAREIVREAVSS